MKQPLTMLAGVCCLLASSACMADAHYAFRASLPGQPNPVPEENNAVFDLFLPDAVTVDSDFSAGQLSSCQIFGVSCAGAAFYIDAQSHGLTRDPGVQAIALSNTTGTTSYYYFVGTAFTRAGTYHSYYAVDQDVTLTTSVPAPPAYAGLLAGLALLGARGRRRSGR